jgi:uncharacterized protein (DUF2147 family)
MKKALWVAASFAIFSAPLLAAADGLTGNWVTPDHSIVAVYPCGPQTVCVKLLQTTDRMAKDDKNPDETLRSRYLCGLQIGRDFATTVPSHAKDGKIYDPDSGQTYSATMSADNSQLKLRGCIGVSLFGRTELWHRSQENITACGS